MKIFNWVQRKLNHNVLKDGFARNVKKTESIAIDTNTKALLEQVALVDVLDGWRDGILTIGTFGFDPLKPLDHTHAHYTSESKDELEDGADHDDQHDYSPMNDNDDDPEEDEEVNPLMSKSFSHSFEDLIASNAADYGNVTVKRNDAILTVDGVPLSPTVSCSGEVRDNVSTRDGNEKKKKRTTLAELFSEESEDIKKENPDELELKFGKKQYVRTKNNGLANAKKLIPHLKEDSRPVKKLNQMMRRMLKRKVHPEIDGIKGSKSEAQNKTSVLAKKHQTAESVSLLHNPDAVV